MSKDFHNRAFDDGTKIKLYIFQEYLKQWLPVFLSPRIPKWQKIYIYDFFAGAGCDSEGTSGSPLLVLDAIKPYCQKIKSDKIEVQILFNEYDREKAKRLKELCAEKLNNCRKDETASNYCPNYNSQNECVFKLVIENRDFKELFSNIYAHMLQFPYFPRFMFIDQFGIKYVTEDIFRKIIQLGRTDFIFFISSSYVRRFGDLPEFKKYLKLSKQDFCENKPHHCHRVIFKYYKSLIPNNMKFYMSNFSIKKNQNIYGLIFGSSHPLGIEKFLKVCWKINPNTGDANYDIDDERINTTEPKLFKEFDIPTKIQLFEEELRSRILSHSITTNKEAYEFGFDLGMLPRHTNKVIQEMKNDGKINNSTPTTSQNIHRLVPSNLF